MLHEDNSESTLMPALAPKLGHNEIVKGARAPARLQVAQKKGYELGTFVSSAVEVNAFYPARARATWSPNRLSQGRAYRRSSTQWFLVCPNIMRHRHTDYSRCTNTTPIPAIGMSWSHTCPVRLSTRISSMCTKSSTQHHDCQHIDAGTKLRLKFRLGPNISVQR